ncbi:BglG family transcription antiterminator [Candidatus Cetobacterium colombiensis]|uniref:Mga helix-turn-helix domain-containing protein n=1 Tax=Candidatus Cetobacterium colombiensis TaxID=3073100 RepID=A0ABU4WDY0_9FUSO|nr:hypothetical protein [Candidatus Cetobacterium colombiensis]MDX8336610.1 hypothetical protein [Candidatus Cetobacterium colombiensis]
MNSTNVGILNLLYHGSFSQKDLALYLDVDSKTLGKNISQLNIELKDLKLNEIKMENGKYKLDLEKDQWTYVLNSKEFMSSEDIIDYLYLKFIFKGFINLEFEKNEFQVSRSSINRYFLVVKNILNENGSAYRYETGKGLRLDKLSIMDKNLFSKKLIKIFVKSDFSITPPMVYYDLFKESRIAKIDGLLEKLYNVFISSEVPATKFIIAFSFALKICVEVFDGFVFNTIYEGTEEYKSIKNNIDIILKEFSPEYKNQILLFILNLKNNETYFEKEIIEKAKLLMRQLKKHLNIDIIEKGFEELLMKKLYMSLFKYENKILNVYSSKLTTDEKRLLKILDETLSETELKMYFYDKVVLLSILKKIIIENNKKKINNVLLLFNEIILPNDLYLKENLKKQIPHINVDILPSFHLQFNYANCIKNYDLILSDEKYQDDNVEKISTFNYIKVLEKIDKRALRKAMDSLKLV